MAKKSSKSIDTSKEGLIAALQPALEEIAEQAAATAADAGAEDVAFAQKQLERGDLLPAMREAYQGIIEAADDAKQQALQPIASNFAAAIADIISDKGFPLPAVKVKRAGRPGSVAATGGKKKGRVSSEDWAAWLLAELKAGQASTPELASKAKAKGWSPQGVALQLNKLEEAGKVKGEKTDPSNSRSKVIWQLA